MLLLAIIILVHWAHPQDVGQRAYARQFPYQVFMKKNGTVWCGGSIISQKFVLTAAHCVEDKLVDRIVAGSIDSESAGDVYEVETSIPHQDYKGMKGFHEHDIALLKMKTDIAFNDNVRLIELSHGPTPTGTDAVVSGWGKMEIGGNLSRFLQYLNTKTMSYEDCAMWQFPPGLIAFKGDVCTFTKREQGTCSGDSGSPLTTNDQLIGIVSRGVQCAQGYPDIFSGVYEHLDWIIKNTLLYM